MSKATVMDKAARKTQLLDIGAKLAAKHGVANVTRRMVAKAAKCSEPLVTNYVGNTSDAQKLYKRHATKLGLTLPTKEQEAAKGAKLRAHGPRDKRDVRPRSAKEVKAIQKKAVTKVVLPATPKSKVAAKKSVKRIPAKPAVVTPAAPKPRSGRDRRAPADKALTPPESKRTAARAPKAPPTLPPIPAPLPPVPAPASDTLN